MKKLAPLLLACAVCVWAADFWTSKPYTDWSAKEVQKIVNDSPVGPQSGRGTQSHDAYN